MATLMEELGEDPAPAASSTDDSGVYKAKEFAGRERFRQRVNAEPAITDLLRDPAPEAPAQSLPPVLNRLLSGTLFSAAPPLEPPIKRASDIRAERAAVLEQKKSELLTDLHRRAQAEQVGIDQSLTVPQQAAPVPQTAAQVQRDFVAAAAPVLDDPYAAYRPQVEAAGNVLSGIARALGGDVGLGLEEVGQQLPGIPEQFRGQDIPAGYDALRSTGSVGQVAADIGQTTLGAVEGLGTPRGLAILGASSVPGLGPLVAADMGYNLATTSLPAAVEEGLVKGGIDVPTATQALIDMAFVGEAGKHTAQGGGRALDRLANPRAEMFTDPANQLRERFPGAKFEIPDPVGAPDTYRVTPELGPVFTITIENRPLPMDVESAVRQGYTREEAQRGSVVGETTVPGPGQGDPAIRLVRGQAPSGGERMVSRSAPPTAEEYAGDLAAGRGRPQGADVGDISHEGFRLASEAGLIPPAAMELLADRYARGETDPLRVQTAIARGLNGEPGVWERIRAGVDRMMGNETQRTVAQRAREGQFFQQPQGEVEIKMREAAERQRAQAAATETARLQREQAGQAERFRAEQAAAQEAVARDQYYAQGEVGQTAAPIRPGGAVENVVPPSESGYSIKPRELPKADERQGVVPVGLTPPVDRQPERDNTMADRLSVPPSRPTERVGREAVPSAVDEGPAPRSGLPSTSEAGGAARTFEGGSVALPPPPPRPTTTPGERLYSIKTHGVWKEEVRKYLSSKGTPEAEIKSHLRGIDGQVKLLEALARKEDPGLEMFPDSAGRVASPFRKNADDLYRFTFDLSSKCVRRQDVSATAAAIIAKLGRPLGPDETLQLVLRFRNAGKTAPCLYCYVESPRRKLSDALLYWRDIMDGKAPADPKYADAVQRFREAGATGKWINHQRFLDPESAPPDANNVVIPDSATAPINEGRPLDFQKFITKIANGAKAKSVDPYEAYSGQALTMDQGWLDHVNARAGVRFLSNSDFQAEHTVDFMQSIFDLSTRGARAHAYTKEPDLPAIFGQTGMKIQTSIFGRTLRDGSVIEDDSLGMKWNDAKAARAKSPDVGPVFVATDFKQIKWALAQPWIDYIIPYHGSQFPAEYAARQGWKDFSGVQHEKWLPGKKPRTIESIPDKMVTLQDGTQKSLRDFVSVETDKDGKVKAKVSIRSQDYLDLANGTPPEAARAKYLEICGELGVSPVFPDFKNDPNYIKLKKDFARTDTPFRYLEPKFDMTAAKRVTDEFVTTGGRVAKPDMTLAEEMAGEFGPQYDETRAHGRVLALLDQNAAANGGLMAQDKKLVKQREKESRKLSEFDELLVSKLHRQLGEEFKASRYSIKPTFEAAKAEKDGEQTIGRPDLANPAGPGRNDRRFVDAVDSTRTVATRKDEDVIAEGKALLEDPAEVRRVRNLMSRGAQMQDHETWAAKELVRQKVAESVTADTDDALADAALAVLDYRKTGETQARAFRQRRDVFESPEARFRHFINEALLLPTGKSRKTIEENLPTAPGEAVPEAPGAPAAAKPGEAAPVAPEAPTATAPGTPGTAPRPGPGAPAEPGAPGDAVAVRAAQGERVRRWLKKQGFDLTRLDSPPGRLAIVQVAERLRGLRSLVKQLEDRGLTKVDIDRLVANPKAETEELTKQLEALALGRDITDAEIRVLRQITVKMRELDKAAFTARIVHGRRDVQSWLGVEAGDLEALKTPDGMQNLRDAAKRARALTAGVRSLDKAKDGLKRAINPGQRALADHVAETRKLKESLLKDGIDLDNLTDAELRDPRQAWKIVRAISAQRASVPDKMYEYWANAILSGPTTHAANLIGNAGSAAYEYLGVLPLEAMANKLRGVPGVQPGDLQYVYPAIVKGLGRGWANAKSSWETEAATLEDQVTGDMGAATALKGDARGAAIKGKTGRVVRTSYRALRAEDEFFKGIIGEMEAVGAALKLGRDKGLAGPELGKFVDEQVGNIQSEAWQSALGRAEYLTFQQPLKSLNEEGLTGLDKAEAGVASVTRGVRAIPGGRYVLPFVTTPMNVFKMAAQRSPLGIVRIGNEPIRSRVIAEQILAWGVAAAVVAGVMNDDEPGITGTEPYEKAGKGKIDILKAGGREPMTARIPFTKTRVGYGRVEPFATQLSFTTDLAEAAKALRAGKDANKVAGDVWASAMGQLKNKTFLQGVGNILKASEDDANFGKWLANFGASWVPALPKQVAESFKGTETEQRVWGATGDDLGPSWGRNLIEKAVQRAFPLAKIAEPKIGVTGEPQEKADEWAGALAPLYRLLVPIPVRRAEDVSPELRAFSEKLIRFNEANPKQTPWWPVPPEPKGTPAERGDDRVTRYLDDKQVRRLKETLGKSFLKAIRPFLAKKEWTRDDVVEIAAEWQAAKEDARDQLGIADLDVENVAKRIVAEPEPTPE